MGVGIGSKSSLVYGIESTFGTHAGSAGVEIPFTTESLQQNIGTIMSERIRADRTKSEIRGGNINAAGDVNNEFSPDILGPFLKHLLTPQAVLTARVDAAYAEFPVLAVKTYVVGETIKDTDTQPKVWVCTTGGSSSGSDDSSLDAGSVGGDVTVAGGAVFHCMYETYPVLASSTYAVGDVIVDTGTPVKTWVCTTAGASGTSVDTTLNTASVGAYITIGAATFKCLFANPVAVVDNTAYTIGQYVLGYNDQLYVCVSGGTSKTSGAVAALTHTTGDSAAGGTNGILWQYYGTQRSTLYYHDITAGYTLPTGGITVEKQVYSSGVEYCFPFLGGRVNTLGLDIPQEGIVTANFGMIFQTMGTASTTSGFASSASVSDTPFTGFEVAVDVNTGSQAISTRIQTASINITNNFDENVYVIGRRYRKDIPEGTREVSGSATIYFEGLTEFNLFANETQFALNFYFINQGKQVKVTIPECKFTGGQPTPNISGAGVISSSFDFQAYKTSSSLFDVKFALWNSTSTI